MSYGYPPGYQRTVHKWRDESLSEGPPAGRSYLVHSPQPGGHDLCELTSNFLWVILLYYMKSGFLPESQGQSKVGGVSYDGFHLCHHLQKRLKFCNGERTVCIATNLS